MALLTLTQKFNTELTLFKLTTSQKLGPDVQWKTQLGENLQFSTKITDMQI